MLIHPNYSRDYRNWAYCCTKMRDLFKKLKYYSAGKITNIGEHYKIQTQGRAAYNEYCLQQCRRISNRLIRYLKLRDKIAAKLDSPEKHLLQREDMLNMVGNVIEITPRRNNKKMFKTLSKCSADGTYISGLDSYDLLSFGYGK